MLFKTIWVVFDLFVFKSSPSHPLKHTIVHLILCAIFFPSSFYSYPERQQTVVCVDIQMPSFQTQRMRKFFLKKASFHEIALGHIIQMQYNTKSICSFGV